MKTQEKVCPRCGCKLVPLDVQDTQTGEVVIIDNTHVCQQCYNYYVSRQGRIEQAFLATFKAWTSC